MTGHPPSPVVSQQAELSRWLQKREDITVRNQTVMRLYQSRNS